MFVRKLVHISCVHKLKFVGLLLLRHAHLHAILLSFSLEDFPDSGIFVFLLDQVSALAGAGLAQAMRASAAAERSHEPFAVAAPGRRDVPRRLAASIKVLMKPTIRWDEQTSFCPINALLRSR